MRMEKQNGTGEWQGSHWIRPEKRERIYQRDSCRCVYCGAQAGDGVRLTLDHVIPRCLGGENSAENLVTACLHCNSSRQDMPVLEFARGLADQGVDPAGVCRRVRNAVRRALPAGR